VRGNRKDASIDVSDEIVAQNVLLDRVAIASNNTTRMNHDVVVFVRNAPRAF